MNVKDRENEASCYELLDTETGNSYAVWMSDQEWGKQSVWTGEMCCEK